MADTTRLESLACPDCGKPIGDIYVIRRKSYLFSGGWLVRSGHNHCQVCGRVFHWDGGVFDKRYNNESTVKVWAEV